MSSETKKFKEQRDKLLKAAIIGESWMQQVIEDTEWESSAFDASKLIEAEKQLAYVRSVIDNVEKSL